MCNHYEKNQLVLEWVVSRFEGIECPPDFATMEAHTWPKRDAPVVIEDGSRRAIVKMRWGVWPFYSREKPQFITNARSDGILVKPIWKKSTALRRCLIPGTGYFEPGLGPPGARGEVLFRLRERSCFFFAGLWDTDPDGSGKRAFAMVTTEPNPFVARFHDRMPVILSDDEAPEWLGQTPLPPERVLGLCRGTAAEAMMHEEHAAQKKIKKADLKSDGELLL